MGKEKTETEMLVKIIEIQQIRRLLGLSYAFNKK